MALIPNDTPKEQLSLSADGLRRFVGNLVASEGVAATGDMAVTQRAAGANLSVDIAAGSALVQGDSVTGQGYYPEYNDATFNLTGFTAAHATLPRIDRVVVRARDQFHGDPDNTDQFVILTGTPTSGATLANTTGAASVGNNQLLLANILVPATATSITTANIDTTGFSNNSPKVRPMLATLNSLGTTYYRKATSKTVNTTVAATDLLNGEITIGAGVMGVTGVARLTAWGDWKQNSGGTSNAYRFQLVLGATTLFDTNAPASVIADGAVRGRWKLVVTIQNATSASAQVADFELQFTPGAASQLIAATSVVFTTGQGIYQNFGRTDGAIPELHAGAYNASSENTALAKALVLNVINPSASANCETVLKGALVEVIP